MKSFHISQKILIIAGIIISSLVITSSVFILLNEKRFLNLIELNKKIELEVVISLLAIQILVTTAIIAVMLFLRNNSKSINNQKRIIEMIGEFPQAKGLLIEDIDKRLEVLNYKYSKNKNASHKAEMRELERKRSRLMDYERKPDIF